MAADAARPTAPTGYRFLSPDESSFVEALVNVICPEDASTPSGVDCGLADYVDHQLACGLTPAQLFTTGVAAAQAASTKRHSKRFEDLALAEADVFLLDVASGELDEEEVSLAQWFNELVFPLLVQACIADPRCGGNQGRVFWKLISYPGLPALNSQNILTYRGKRVPAAPDPKSILEFSS